MKGGHGAHVSEGWKVKGGHGIHGVHASEGWTWCTCE